MKQEVNWVDLAKFIGIFLVIIGHVLQKIPGWQDTGIRVLWDWIYLFHMPLFFVISGYLYTKKNNHDLKNIFYALVIPYILYQCLYLPLWNWKVLLSDEGILEFWVKHTMGILMGDGYETPYSHYSCLPCWFIISIIQLRCLFCFVKINVMTIIAMCSVSIFFMYYRTKVGFDLYCCIDSTIMAIPYFLFGYLLKKSNFFGGLNPYIIGESNNMVLRCIIFAALVTLIYYYNGPSQMIGPSVGKDVLANYFAGVSGTLLVFNVSSRVKHVPVYIKRISRNTLFIIFFHWCCLCFVRKQFFFEQYAWINILLGIIYSMIILCVNYLAIKKLEESWPLILGKIKK